MNRLDHRLVSNPFDREHGRGAFLQLIGLQAVGKFLSVDVKELGVRDDRRRSLLSAGGEANKALLAVHPPDFGRDFERRSAATPTNPFEPLAIGSGFQALAPFA